MNKPISRKIKSGITAFIIAVALSVCSGCSFFGSGSDLQSIEFRSESISMTVGETLKIDSAYIVYTPETVSDKSFTVTSSDENVVSVADGNVITALKEGAARITASTKRGGKTARCNVSVSKREAKEIKIVSSGNLFQRAGEVSAVEFSALFDVRDTDKVVSWQVTSGGIAVDSAAQAQSEKYLLTPEKLYGFSDGGVGLYTITASASGRNGEVMTAWETVGVYADYVEPPVLGVTSGELVQEENSYGTVTFDLSYEDADGNPERVIEWFVEGESVWSGGKTFAFTPSAAGAFQIWATVGGERTKEVFTVTAKGSIVPSNLRFDADGSYPDITVSWDASYPGLDYEVDIRTADGGAVLSDKISTLNGSTARFFSADKLSVNLREFIGDGSARNIFNTAFSVRVRSLGGGNGFTESDYCEPIVTPIIDSAAKKYLERKYYDGYKNYYITSDDEFVDLFAYLFLWRENPKLGILGKDVTKTDMYMAYTPDSVSNLITYAFDVLHFTGSNSFDYDLGDDGILNLTVNFLTDSIPSASTAASERPAAYRGGSNATRPHFNYDGGIRSRLPIENRAQSITVTTSEQLYYITQLGYKPRFSGQSTAKRMYDYAADVLKYIISDKMTDVEKAHAIYDWVMLQVDYDYAATRVSDLSKAVKYNAYYLEGVFTDSGAYAVCDGIAKAYALMCNMENIECMRIAGTAGSKADEANWGGHAWNKVKVDGQWYIVDCTWGDESMSVWGNPVYHEMAFHRYFLLTDAEIESTHAEDEPNRYPRTTVRSYNWYDDETEYEGGTLDFYINTTEKAAIKEAETIARYIDYRRTDETNALYAKLYSPYGSKWLSSDYIAFDIRVSGNLAYLFGAQNQSNPFRTAFIKLGYKENVDFRIQSDGNYVFIVVKGIF